MAVARPGRVLLVKTETNLRSPSVGCGAPARGLGRCSQVAPHLSRGDGSNRDLDQNTREGKNFIRVRPRKESEPGQHKASSCRVHAILPLSPILRPVGIRGTTVQIPCVSPQLTEGTSKRPDLSPLPPHPKSNLMLLGIYA